MSQLTHNSSDEEVIKVAQDQNPEVEIDADAVVSHGDDPGACVQAWVWVDFNEDEEEPAKDSTYPDGFKRYRVVGFEHDDSFEILSSFNDKTDAEHSLCWFLDDPDSDVYLVDVED